MNQRLATWYRTFVPDRIRHRIFLARRERRLGPANDWNDWADQELGASLSIQQLRRHAGQYDERRSNALAASKRLYTRDYETQLTAKNRDFWRACTAAKYYETEPLLDDHVMYDSYNGRDFGCNPYALFRYLIEHPDYRHLHHVIAVHDVENPKIQPYRRHPRVTVVTVHSDAFIRYSETCKYYINNASYKAYLIKRPGQIYFTTWHSTLLKKLAYDTGRPWEAANVARALVASDIHLSPNAHTTEHLFRSHGVDGLLHGAVYEMGYPRNDLTVNVDKGAVREQLKVAPGTKVAVYAPTWRGEYTPEDTAQETLDQAETIRNHLPEDYELFVQFHTLVYKFVDESTVQGAVPRGLDTNELLGATDLLITDYSGIFYDYLLTGKPVVFYTPDRAAYEKRKHGFYLELDDLPGPLCDDYTELGAALADLDEVQRRYADRYESFVERFVSGDDGNACERAARLLFRGERFDRYLSAAPGASPDGKPIVLIHPGGLPGNGVTTSFISLTKQFDYDSYNLVVLLPSTKKEQKVQQQIDRRARIFYENATEGFLADEFTAYRAMAAFGATQFGDVPAAAFTRTLRRTFADLPIDVTINYHGYNTKMAFKLATGIAARRRLIYLHNDLERDRAIKHRQLLSVFSSYALYDGVICVSADSLEQNIEGAARRLQYVFGCDVTESMDYSKNLIVPEEIVARGTAGTLVRVDEEGFLILRDSDERLASGIAFDPSLFNFVCVARLSPEKNHERLIAAFARTTEVRKDVRLYIMGEGAQRKRLERIVDALSLRDKVIFTGFVSNPLAIVDRADAFVLASDIEGQPITVLEALVLGTPVIATDIPGPHGLLNTGAGKLVAPTVEAFASAMIEQLVSAPAYEPFIADEYVASALSDLYRHIEGAGTLGARASV